MAGVFKTFLSNDTTAVRTLMNEGVSLTGSALSGAFLPPSGAQVGDNVQTYSHGMFWSVYDAPITSSSANKLFDITVGYHTSSLWLTPSDSHFTKKQVVYSQLANVLMGQDVTGSVNLFDADGDISSGGTKYTSSIAIPFARTLVKDEIKKGSFSMTLGVDAFASPFATTITLTDDATDYRVNSPAGEYGILRDSFSQPSGLLFYQAGVAIINLEAFAAVEFNESAETFADRSGSLIGEIAGAIYHRLDNISFSNTLELNSTIYFCRLNHNEFNYSSNPTYVSGSEIIIKNHNANELPATYITTIGLYGSDNGLLAVAKLSQPIRKSADNELVIRARADF